MNNKILVVLGALVLALSIPLSNVYAKTQPFLDVPATKHFAEAVNELAERNIIGGYPDGTFKPGNSITRGQAAAIIAKMTKLDTTNVKGPKFKDVTTANGYYKAIAALAEKGVINGYGDGRFGPNDPITRAQIASIIIKAFELPLYEEPKDIDPKKNFKDIHWKSSHRAGIYSMYQLNLTTGTTPTTYSPNESVTRGQAAKLLKAAEDVKRDILTLYPTDYKWQDFTYEVNKREQTSDVFDIIASAKIKQKSPYNKIQIVPKKEGKGILHIRGNYQDDSTVGVGKYKIYYVIVKKVNGEWDITLEETADTLPAPVQLETVDYDFPTSEKHVKVKSISLSTVEGKIVNNQLSFERCKGRGNNCNVVHIGQVGEFIATVRYVDDKVERYYIKSTELADKIYYSIDSLAIRPERYIAESPEGSEYITDKGSEKIATVTVTSDPDGSIFHITAKQEGEFYISLYSDKNNPGTNYYEPKIKVTVKKYGTYLHTGITIDYGDADSNI